MARTQEWAKLDLGWYSNRKVKRVTRRFGPVAGAYWTMLIALAKDASHHAVNPTGVFETCMQDLADNLHDRRHRVTLFEEFIAAKLVRVSGSDWATDPEAAMTIELVDFGGHQNPKGSPADRQAKKRSLQGSVTQSHIPSHSVTREEERREEKEDLKVLSDSPSSNRDEHIKEVLKHWQEVFGKQRSAITGPKGAKRRSRVRSRLAEGFTVEQLKTAIDGFARSDYHTSNGYVGVETVLRDALQVEKGIDLANPKPRALAGSGNAWAGRIV